MSAARHGHATTLPRMVRPAEPRGGHFFLAPGFRMESSSLVLSRVAAVVAVATLLLALDPVAPDWPSAPPDDDPQAEEGVVGEPAAPSETAAEGIPGPDPEAAVTPQAQTDEVQADVPHPAPPADTTPDPEPTRTVIKKLKTTTVKSEASELLKQVSAMIDKLAKNNIIHWKNAANQKSKLTKFVNGLEK